MPDHREELAGISSTSSTYQAHSSHESEGDREFSFWGSSNIISSENACDQLEDSEASLKIEAELPLWEAYKRKNCKYEHSPFLPRNRSCSLSFPSQREVIAEGRGELMQMIRDMPESSFELSFQDMVNEQQVQQQDRQNETSVDNTLVHSSKKSQTKMLNKKKENKSNRSGQISRVESMDSETFRLKMFFPTSLAWIKKTKVKNGSDVSQRPSFQESRKQIGKVWRIKGFFVAGDNRGDVGDSISQNTNSIKDKSRYDDHNFSFSLGCWSSFHYTKSKTKK